MGSASEVICSLLSQAADAAQAAQAAAAASSASKKPVSPYAAMWAKPGAATTAKPPAPLPVEPVRQKVVLLGQVFDMLTDMEKDITSSMVRLRLPRPSTGSTVAAV